MLISGIDETTTDTRLHIDQVEFDDTSNGTPVFRFKRITSTLFGSQLQINTRSQCQMVMTGTIVAGLVVLMRLFPLVEGLTHTLRFQVGIMFSICVGCTHVRELHITSQGTKVVHIAVDTEIVAVNGIVSRIASLTFFLVQ